jgi:cytochrome c oxidase cbb3-type subunit 4
MTFSSFMHDAQMLSLVAVCVTFSLIVAYALWPSRQKSFDEAAHLPLNED